MPSYNCLHTKNKTKASIELAVNQAHIIGIVSGQTVVPSREVWEVSNCIHAIMSFFVILGPLNTWVWEPVTSTLQALSLVEKAEPVQVCFTLCLRDQRSMWMQDGCKVYMESYGIELIMFNGHLDYFQKPTLGGRPNKSGRPWHSKRSQPLVYSILSCMRTRMNRNLLK